MSQADAVAAMRVAGLRTAMPWDTLQAIADRGACFEFNAGAGPCVVVAHQAAGVLWIDAAAAPAGGAGMTASGLALAEETARLKGCDRVAFETVRPGLVRRAKKHGYAVVGYILEKALR